eukprot:COSAG06_NODE_779_length_12371_cov_6.466102_4_plen_217_part_00
MRRAAAAAPVPALRWPYSSPPPPHLRGAGGRLPHLQGRATALQGGAKATTEARARAGRAGVTFLGHGLGVPAAAGAAGLRRRSCLPFARFASFASRQFRLAQQPPQTPQSIVPIHRPSDIRRYRCRPAKTTFGARGSVLWMCISSALERRHRRDHQDGGGWSLPASLRRGGVGLETPLCDQRSSRRSSRVSWWCGDDGRQDATDQRGLRPRRDLGR